MAEKKVAIIGGGLGGLSAALRLKTIGFDVDVYEKNDSVGGKAGQVVNSGFRFDAGPSLLTMPFVLKELFEFAGENLEDYLTLNQLDIICKYFYPDKTEITAYSNLNDFAVEIEKKTKDNEAAVKSYLNYCRNIYDLSSDLFLFNSFADKKNFISKKALRTLINIKSLDTGRTMHNANKSFFNDEKTIQLFDRYATYNGSNPYKAPATLNIIQHVEYNLGSYIVLEGIYEIPKSIEKVLYKKGVNVFVNSDVQKIIADKRKIKGIVVNAEERNYDIVLSNVDVSYTYQHLLSDENSRGAKKYRKLEPSSSAIVFYWGVKGLHNQLETHNILFSDNYKKEFEQLFLHKLIPDDPTIYIYISSKFNKNDAPQGSENWFVMINAPYSNEQLNENIIAEIRTRIIKKIKNVLKIDIEKKILTEDIMTPKDIERKTNSLGGSIYGISSNSKMAAFLRQQNRSKDYKGLYFCGGSVHPGGGIPLVILSGKLAAEQIERYEAV
jgi:phytoene desaturase